MTSHDSEMLGVANTCRSYHTQANYIVMAFICIMQCYVCLPEVQPNIILIVADDMGYGDLAIYGHPTQEWNILDQMASEGVRFTQFYSPATFCSPSRAALLTGRLPVRLGMSGDKPVFLPEHSTGLPRSEETLAELLRDAGYHTGMVGKWHLGINQHHSRDGYHLPSNHGFNYVGTNFPFSLETVCDETQRHRNQPRTSRCFLYHGDILIQQPLKLSNMTATVIADVKGFLYDHAARQKDLKASQPFFLYLSLPQPHTPMFNDARFKGKSVRGEYGDQVAEMAWAVEETMAAVRQMAAANDTLVAFVSDHGPHREMCSEGGSTGPLKGGKGTFYEGGVRVPAFVWWPGHIHPHPANPALASHMDLFVTLADSAGAKRDQTITTDGVSLRDLLENRETISPRKSLFFYSDQKLVAVRYGRYKVHFYNQGVISDTNFPHCTNGISPADFYYDFSFTRQRLEHPVVYDLESDPGEQWPISNDKTKGLLHDVDEEIKKHQVDLVIPEKKLFSQEFMSHSLVPCCNPPYCICT